MPRLRVWKTLRKGRVNHWMLGSSKLLEHTRRHEVYAVTHRRLRWLDAFEALCGYVRVRRDGCYVYVKRRKTR